MQEVNTKLDILFVVDNSGSMADEQEKLRNGFVSFANRYMQPTWDIRLAVITSDTYLANPAFTNHLNATITGTGNYGSPYINGVTSNGIPGRSDPLTNPNPHWNNGLFVWDAGTSRWRIRAAGLTAKHIRPNLGPNWAKLLDVDPATGKGNHDGPPVQICSEVVLNGAWHFLHSTVRCDLRDDIARAAPPANTDISNCVSPQGGERVVDQCLNTGRNDTVHSGKSIITTFGVNQNTLINQFLVNVSVGISGSGTETGINSLLQLINDNEAPSSTTKFFREKSLRVVIFVSDEEDLSVVYPSNGTQVTPWQYFVSGAPCQKTVDGHTYTIGQCANPSLVYPANGSLIPIPEVKSRLDTFFRTLDGSAPTDDPNYFITTITALTAASVQSSGDQATRNLELGQAVGNGSLELEINSADYSPLLDAIGRVILQKKGRFELNHPPTGQSDMIVKIRHANGSETIVPASKYSIVGNYLTFTDEDLILSLAETDVVIVNYQPKTMD